MEDKGSEGGAVWRLRERWALGGWPQKTRMGGAGSRG